METKDVIIIGGGPAGITFGRATKSMRPDASVLMFRPESHSLVYCAIPYAIEGLFEPERINKRDALVTDVGIELSRQRIARVDLAQRIVTAEDGTQWGYDQLFIATGASPVLPTIPGSDSRNVFTVKTAADMNGLIDRIELGAQRAVVIGAGAIGIEQAQAYKTRGLETWLVDLAPHVLPSMIDEDMSGPLHEAIRAKGIELRLAQKVEGLSTRDGAVDGVVLSSGEQIVLDAGKDFVCFAVGMKPDVELFAASSLAMSRDGIEINERMETNIPGVYAAGDCCAYRSALDGKPLGGRLATNSVPMAKVAAKVAAGKDASYAGFYNGAATCVDDWRVGGTGFSETMAERRGLHPVCGYGETTTLFPMMPGADVLQVKVVADRLTGRVIGGQVLSKVPVTDKIDVITLAIQQRMTLAELATLSYSSQPWQSFFPARNAIVEACENALRLIGSRQDSTA